MDCKSIEVLRRFWPSYRKRSWYHITIYQFKAVIHAVHWLTHLIYFRKLPSSILTLKVKHSEFYCGISQFFPNKYFGPLHITSRHYNFFHNTSSSLQTNKRTVRRWLSMQQMNTEQIPVAAWCKSWVCGRSLAGIVVSNPPGGMYVCLLSMLCVIM